MKETKKYWKGLEELNQEPEFVQNKDREFPDYLPLKESRPSDSGDTEGSSRRDFLKLMGFGVAAASLAACETPAKYAVPYVNKPETIDPGKPVYYASTYYDGDNFANLLIKTREGRPIHLEGNQLSSITGKGLNAQVSASILNLYDSSRLQHFQKATEDKKFENVSKSTADAEIKTALQSAKNIRIVSKTILSPSTKQVISDFKTVYPSTKLVQYDPISMSGLRQANGGIIPSYRFDKAKAIVSFNADFLSSWLSPIEFSSQYVQNRKLKKGVSDMSVHYQFETILSLTGSNADYRTPIKASQEAGYIVSLYNLLAKKAGASTYTSPLKETSPNLAKAADALWKNRGASLVVSGSNDVAVQKFVAEINKILNNEGTTVDFSTPCNFKQGNDASLANLLVEIANGQVDAVIFYGANPVYDSVIGTKLEAALSKVKTKISFNDRIDETSALVDYICSDLNSYESWGDTEAYAGKFGLIQPTISPIFKGLRSAQESLLTWSGNSESYYDYLKKFWESKQFAAQSSDLLFASFWDKTLQKGVFETKKKIAVTNDEITEDVVDEEITETTNLSGAASLIAKSFKPSEGLELVLYTNTAMGSGGQANNVWLQELPDPISKVCWDNYAAISQADAASLGYKQGDIVKIVAPGIAKIEVPVLVQPGQAQGTMAIALGYGREKAGVVTDRLVGKSTSYIHNPSGINAEGKLAVGSNAYPFVNFLNGTVNYTATGVTITSVGTTHKLAQTQTQQTIMGRAVVQEATLSEYQKKADAGRFYPVVHTSKGAQKPNEVDIWSAPAATTKEEYQKLEKEGVDQEVKTHTYPNHHWGLVIDLNSCIGCSACTVSCHVENNVPVVGKDEVLRKRDMHWLRIDRYYASQPEMDAYANEADRLKAKNNSKKSGYSALENPADNPEVVFQPMMCQHCNNAPCETVCPVAATTHSTEGLNQMTYNRCIGTRYCANNCPYKVRRFNWFNYSDNAVDEREFSAVNYPANDDLGKMVLNPDVTVRARGVMEKCSMCVQRIQAGKLEAKSEGRKLEDGDVVTACASVCPTEAILFGDMNDPKSKISIAMNEENKERNFQVLEEINVKPNVSYLTKIRNKA